METNTSNQKQSDAQPVPTTETGARRIKKSPKVILGPQTFEVYVWGRGGDGQVTGPEGNFLSTPKAGLRRR